MLSDQKRKCIKIYKYILFSCCRFRQVGGNTTSRFILMQQLQLPKVTIKRCLQSSKDIHNPRLTLREFSFDFNMDIILCFPPETTQIISMSKFTLQSGNLMGTQYCYQQSTFKHNVFDCLEGRTSVTLISKFNTSWSSIAPVCSEKLSSNDLGDLQLIMF